MTVSILQGDVREVLATLPTDHFDCCVTSPPYWGLRDYGVDGQIGLEPTLDAYLDTMVDVCRKIRRVLKPQGTFWLNVGDSYAGSWGTQSRGGPPSAKSTLKGNGHEGGGPKLKSLSHVQIREAPKGQTGTGSLTRTPGLKPKDLCMVPNRLAILLQEDGWYVRSEIIWHKPNAMPESVTDRPTTAHEKVWLLTKSGTTTIWRAKDTLEWSLRPDLSERVPAPTDDDPCATTARWRGFDYFYDADAIREAESVPDWDNGSRVFGGVNKAGANVAHGDRTTGRVATARKRGVPPRHAEHETCDRSSLDDVPRGGGRNARNVWTIATRPFPEAHFATMTPDLAERCIKAGCPAGGHVLDPFGGAGTTGLVADRLGRSATLVELNPGYAALARRRIDEARLGPVSRASSQAKAKMPAAPGPLFGVTP